MNSTIPLILPLLVGAQSVWTATPDVVRGEAFYRSTHGGDWSCATCHTDNPMAEGRHTVTKKAIRPLAPAANADRFTNPEKVEKWFRRNCNDVLKRACTAQEKDDFVAFLRTVK